jgi:hypothetical protein
MPRRAKPPRLYLDSSRGEWVIRDREHFVRTGCLEADTDGASAKLAEYLANVHRPTKSRSPLIADVLLMYIEEHLTHSVARRQNFHFAKNVEKYWGDKRASDITPESQGGASLRFFERHCAIGTVVRSVPCQKCRTCGSRQTPSRGNGGLPGASWRGCCGPGAGSPISAGSSSSGTTQVPQWSDL